MSANARKTFRTSPSSNALVFDEPREAPANFPVDDPLSLFLSDLPDKSDTQPDPFVARKWTSILARAVAGGLVASAFAILVAIGSATRDHATQTASNEPATRQILLNDNPPRSTTTMTPASVSSERVAKETATRKDNVSDDRMAQQGQVEAARESASPLKTLDAETLTALLTRGKKMLALGDIGAARLLLERAANAQDASAAFLLARTYDSTVLGSPNTRTVTPDARLARDWYRKAAALGSSEAQKRLTHLQK
jgi:hypothetical protein